MDEILGHLGDKGVIFLDAMVIHTKTIEEHTQLLDRAISVLKDASLYINRMKTKICAQNIRYLGFIMSENGLQPDDTKIECIETLPPPHNVKSLRRSLGRVL